MHSHFGWTVEKEVASQLNGVLQLQGSGVSISIGFPADMRGASYAQEELIKVLLCACLVFLIAACSHAV